MLKSNEIAYWCAVKKGQLYVPNHTIPLEKRKNLAINEKFSRQIGEYQDVPFFWLEIEDDADELPLEGLRTLLDVDSALFSLASKAVQLSHMWDQQQFCPKCGQACQLSKKAEIPAMVCHGCQQPHYPRISPCIIVAVRKDDKVLLAQHPRHRNGMFTVIAGFVEPGETLECCVAREIKEETGINVNNIRYFGSQPWAFPSNLMMAFLADFAGGEIKPDYSELTDAIWATEDNLPLLPPEGTIARALIEQTLQDIQESKSQQ